MEDSIREARGAVEIDPLSIYAVSGLGILLVIARKYDEAIITLNRALELDGRFFPAYIYLASAYEAKGERARAIECAENSERIAPLPIAFRVRGWLYGLDGRLDEAQRMLDELKEQTKRAYVSPMHFARLYCGTGDVEAWRKAMWKAYEERSGFLVFLKVNPAYDRMRTDPVYHEIARKIGLP